MHAHPNNSSFTETPPCPNPQIYMRHQKVHVLERTNASPALYTVVSYKGGPQYSQLGGTLVLMAVCA